MHTCSWIVDVLPFRLHVVVIDEVSVEQVLSLLDCGVEHLIEAFVRLAGVLSPFHLIKYGADLLPDISANSLASQSTTCPLTDLHK